MKFVDRSRELDNFRSFVALGTQHARFLLFPFLSYFFYSEMGDNLIDGSDWRDRRPRHVRSLRRCVRRFIDLYRVALEARRTILYRDSSSRAGLVCGSGDSGSGYVNAINRTIYSRERDGVPLFTLPKNIQTLSRSRIHISRFRHRFRLIGFTCGTAHPTVNSIHPIPAVSAFRRRAHARFDTHLLRIIRANPLPFSFK